MSRRWAKEPAAGEGPPNDARVDPVPSPSPAPTKQTIASIKRSETPSQTASSSFVSVTSLSKSSVTDSSTLKVSTKTTTTSLEVSTSSISTSITATSTFEYSSASVEKPSQLNSSTLPKGTIIVIAIGGVFAVCVFAFLARLLFRRRRQQQKRRKPLDNSRSPPQNPNTESRHSNPQLYSKVSTSSNTDSSSGSAVGSSDTSSNRNSVQPEMLYSYSYPDSNEGEMTECSLAEVDARLFVHVDSRRFSGASGGSSFYAPSELSVESQDDEGECLRSEHNHSHDDIEGSVPPGSEFLTAIPLPRKSSKRKITSWHMRSMEDSRPRESDTAERPGSGLERRSEAGSVGLEGDRLIERWDTVSIKTNGGCYAVENKRKEYDIGEMSMGEVSRMGSQASNLSRAQSIISDEALEFLGVGRRTGSFQESVR